jgi:nucleotidyltransferase AbiEii toxin of type IV toxin-antitoxin system
VNVSLSTDLDDPSAIPYFLWDEPMTVSEFRHRLKTASTEEQTRLLAKMLREARDTDVWKFISPEEVWRRLPEVSAQLGRRRQFWQFILERWNQEGLAVLVDLVRDRVKQIVPEKPVTHGIRIDSPEEILANKLCALLSYSEIRDLVDVRALEMAGYRVEDAVPAAHLKDTGLTPAQLSWVLGQIRLGGDLVPPGGVSGEELREYLKHLIDRLARLAFPS